MDALDRGDSSEIAEAGERARLWLAAHADSLPAYVFLLGDHLRRRFGTELPTGGDLLARAAEDGPDAEAQMRVYRRLVDPSVAITPAALASLSDEVDRLTGPALACDQVPLPSGYTETLQTAIDKGGYERTHAVLALQWLVEHRCIDVREASRLSDRWADALVDTVEERRGAGDGSGDLAIEAMVMLIYSGHRDRVRPEWVADVLASQRADGAWQQHAGDPSPNPHATVLALWLMLDLAQPDVPSTSWIPDP